MTTKDAIQKHFSITLNNLSDENHPPPFFYQQYFIEQEMDQ